MSGRLGAPGGVCGRAASTGHGAVQGGVQGPGQAILSILCPFLPDCLSLLQGPRYATCSIVCFLNARNSRLVVAYASAGFGMW